jgi:hypothetical protein
MMSSIILLFIKYYRDDQIKKDSEMGRVCSAHEEDKSA